MAPRSGPSPNMDRCKLGANGSTIFIDLHIPARAVGSLGLRADCFVPGSVPVRMPSRAASSPLWVVLRGGAASLNNNEELKYFANTRRFSYDPVEHEKASAVVRGREGADYILLQAGGSRQS